MLHKRFLFVSAIVALALCLTSGVALAVLGPVGNDFYEVFVQDSGGGLGRFTARTGPDHPVTISTGSAQNVLFGGQSGGPGTSFMTVRSFTTNTDYVDLAGDPPSLTSSATVKSLDPYATVEPTGTTGGRTTWVLPGGQTTPDDLTIVEDVAVTGTTANNSVIGVTTTITNNGEAAVNIGVRYLWDWTIGNDDGPTFAAVSPDGAALSTEQTFAPPNFTMYAIADNNSVDSPLFVVYGTANGPTTISPQPTAPDELMFASWPNSIDTAFDYTTSPSRDIASAGGTDDSATLYFWGPDSDHAISIPAGQSVTVSASLIAGEANEPPPILATPTPIRHRKTATPTEEPTDTPAPPTATRAPMADMVPPPTNTPTGGSGPVISPPSTGDGSGSGSSPMLPILATGLIVAAAIGGAATLRLRARRD